MRKINLSIFFIFLLLFLASCGVPASVPLISNKSADKAETKEENAYITKGSIWYNKGCYNRSLKSFFKAHEDFSIKDNLSGTAKSLNYIGIVYKSVKDYKYARLFFKEAFKIYSDIKDYKGAIRALYNMAGVSISLEDFDDAMHILNDASLIMKNKNVQYPPILTAKGIIFTKQKKYDEAIAFFDKAEEKIHRSDSYKKANLNFAIAKLMSEMKKYDAAMMHLNISLNLDRSSGFYSGMAEDLFLMGNIALGLNKPHDAIGYLKRSVKIYAQMEEPEKTKEVMALLESVAKKNNENIDLIKTFINSWRNDGMCF